MFYPTRLLRLGVLLTALSLLACASAAANADDQDDAEAAIHAAAQSYAAAFNNHDAKAVAEHWSETGDWVTPSGQALQGRDAIREQMEAYFAEGGSPHVEVAITNIRQLAPTVVTEEGIARVTREGEPTSETTYLAIHIKEGDQWRLDSVRETAAPELPSNYDHLKELEWMVGEWTDQDDESTVETRCEWTRNRNFLMRTFKVMFNDQTEMEGTQIIGWDASAGTIRSWLFDSTGGFGGGVWSRDGDRWMIRYSQTSRDGEKSSAIHVLTYVDENTCTFESTSREIDGELLPSIGPVDVVRKATVSGSGEQEDLR